MWLTFVLGQQVKRTKTISLLLICFANEWAFRKTCESLLKRTNAAENMIRNKENVYYFLGGDAINQLLNSDLNINGQ